MINERYSDEELVTRLWDKEEVKDLMSRRCYYKQNDWRQRELDELWVTEQENRATASLANNLGYFVGMADITAYYVDGLREKREAQLALVRQTRPDAQYGNSVMNAHTYHTVMVELAADGKTARYLAYDHGHQTDPQPDGSAKGYWTSGHLLADLMKENGVWKIWHIKSMHDLSIPAAPVPGAMGGGFGGPPPEDAGEGGPPDGAPPEGGEPGGPGGPPPMPDLGPDPYEDDYGTPTVAKPYIVKWAWNDLPKQMPNTYAPHETFDPSVSYGPEGHPDPLRSWR
jgi:hypothetical protein